MKIKTSITAACVTGGVLAAMVATARAPTQVGFDAEIARHARAMMDEGRKTFRYDTFGSEAYWGDALQLHRAIAGEKNGGVGPGVSPKTALSVGLKVDADALPQALKQQLKEGKVNLDDPATTIALLKLNAVVGVTAFANPDGSVKSMFSLSRWWPVCHYHPLAVASFGVAIMTGQWLRWRSRRARCDDTTP